MSANQCLTQSRKDWTVLKEIFFKTRKRVLTQRQKSKLLRGLCYIGYTWEADVPSSAISRHLRHKGPIPPKQLPARLTGLKRQDTNSWRRTHTLKCSNNSLSFQKKEKEMRKKISSLKIHKEQDKKQASGTNQKTFFKAWDIKSLKNARMGISASYPNSKMKFIYEPKGNRAAFLGYVRKEDIYRVCPIYMNLTEASCETISWLFHVPSTWLILSLSLLNCQ